MADVRLIDANALKTEMADDLAATIRMSEMRKTDMAVRVLNKIDEANTIDAVEVVHGRWMTNEYGNTVCSACSCELPGFHCYDEETDEEWDEQIDETLFCPYCGAKMDGGAEG